MSKNNKKLVINIDNVLTQKDTESNCSRKNIRKQVAISIKNSISLGYESKIFSINNIQSINQHFAKNWLKENNINYEKLLIGAKITDENNITLEQFIFKFSGPYWNKTLDIIIPFFNEEGNVLICHNEHKKIEKFFNVNRYLYIDNGSLDNTYKNLKEVSSQDKKIKIISVKNNIGYGYGVKQGLKNSFSDLVLLNHADLQFNPYSFFEQNLSTFLSLSDPLNIFPQRFNRPSIDKINSAFLRFLLSIIYIDRIPDFNGQPKVFSIKNLEDINKLPNNFCIDLAIFRKCKDYSITLPSIQKDRYSGKSSWNGDFVKRSTIFLEYLFYAIKKRKE